MKLNYKTTALLEIDIQNDFCPAYRGKDGKEYPNGALAVNCGNEIIAPVNCAARMMRQNGGNVLATQDWHPSDHISFAASHQGKNPGDIISLSVPEDAIKAFHQQYPDIKDPIPTEIQQVLWPAHCVQHTQGAAFHDELDTTLIDEVFRKGSRRNIDSYSAFFENDRCTATELYAYLKEHTIDTLVVAGLATDYCVLYSVIDSLRLGIKTFVLEDGCRGIDMPSGSVNAAISAMKKRGAVFVRSGDFET